LKIVFFSQCIGSNHVKLHTRFWLKNKARTVWRSPSARTGNTMAKRKRTSIDLQNATQKTIFSPTATFLHRKQKSNFIFWTYKQSVICLQIVIINLSLKNAEPDYCPDIFASFRSIYFVSLKLHHIICFSEKKHPKS